MDHECVFVGFQSGEGAVRLCPTCMAKEPTTAIVAEPEPEAPEPPASQDDDPSTEVEEEEAAEDQQPEEDARPPRARGRR